MTIPEYRSHPAVHFSTLKAILRSPAHYKTALASKKKPTWDMEFGTALHGMVLDGKQVHEVANVKPEDFDGRKKEWKEWLKDHPGFAVTTEEADDLIGMRESIQRNLEAGNLLAGCPIRETPELSTIQGVDCRCLPDARGVDHEGRIIMLDIKTTDDARQPAFQRVVENFHYDLQAALYCSIVAMASGSELPPRWFWIAVEKEAPYAVQVWEASQDHMEAGMRKLDRCLALVKACRESGNWPAYASGILTLTRPAWANNENQ